MTNFLFESMRDFFYLHELNQRNTSIFESSCGFVSSNSTVFTLRIEPNIRTYSRENTPCIFVIKSSTTSIVVQQRNRINNH